MFKWAGLGIQGPMSLKKDCKEVDPIASGRWMVESLMSKCTNMTHGDIDALQLSVRMLGKDDNEVLVLAIS